MSEDVLMSWQQAIAAFALIFSLIACAHDGDVGIRDSGCEPAAGLQHLDAGWIISQKDIRVPREFIIRVIDRCAALSLLSESDFVELDARALSSLAPHFRMSDAAIAYNIRAQQKRDEIAKEIKRGMSRERARYLMGNDQLERTIYFRKARQGKLRAYLFRSVGRASGYFMPHATVRDDELMLGYSLMGSSRPPLSFQPVIVFLERTPRKVQFTFNMAS